ncbi:MAG: DUF6062 family protein [Chloroflexota bacterium]
MTPELPARDIGDVHLAELFATPGCPLCRHRTNAGRRYIGALLDEGVNDVPFRRALDRARGFCARHTREILAIGEQGGGILGPAILFAAVLTLRRRELDAAFSARGRSRGRLLADARRPADCVVCREELQAEETGAHRLAELADVEEWRSALMAATFCVEHLLVVASAARDGTGWRTVEAAQASALADIDDRLRAFAHHSSHDRRHLLTDDERRSVREAAAVLAGEAPDGGAASS